MELVPPPEEKKPEPKPKEKPPEPKPPEQAKKQPPPPPPPPPRAENKPLEQAKPAAPMPGLKPVFEFGDRDSGPKRSMMGNSSGGEAKPATTAPQHDAKPEREPEEASAEKPQTERTPARPVPDDIQLPEVAATDVSPERNAPLAEATGGVKTDIEALKPHEQNPPEPPKTDAKKDNLVKAKTLFSQVADDDPVARIAMDGVPRGKRVAQLCRSELQQQLIHASPSFQPIIVPSQSLPYGTVLDLRAAFRTVEDWYDVHFRCEVDEDALKVVSFAFDVGDKIPKDQWKGRGFLKY